MNPYEAVDAFMVHLKAEQGASVHTIEAYNRDILHYLIFLEDSQSSLESVAMEAYLHRLKDRGEVDAHYRPGPLRLEELLQVPPRGQNSHDEPPA